MGWNNYNFNNFIGDSLVDTLLDLRIVLLVDIELKIELNIITPHFIWNDNNKLI